MNRQALMGVGIGLAFLALMMVWVQIMVVPALRPERHQTGAALPSDQLGAPTSDADAAATSPKPAPKGAPDDGSATRDQPRRSPALFDTEETGTASNREATDGGDVASDDNGAAKAEADRVIERMQALAADGSADPEKMADLLSELRRNASSQIAEEVDLAEMERYLRQVARVQKFGQKMGQLEPGANPEDSERAMELSNQMLTDMMTQPAFDNVEVPADIALPQGGEAVGVSPSIHLSPQILQGRTGNAAP